MRNDRGSRMMEFAEVCSLVVANSMAQKKISRKWTSHGPNIKKELVYILLNRRRSLRDCGVMNQFDAGSDHSMVRCAVCFNVKLERRNRVNIGNLRMKSDEFDREISNQLALVPTETEDVLLNAIKLAALKVGGYQTGHKVSKLTDETKALQYKRRKMRASLRTRRQRNEYASLSALVMRKVRCAEIQHKNSEAGYRRCKKL
ncbi:hypothetical protein WA026_021716 [Henosepilachna vigintioctopunctata]|uniref:Uncharacterized protein n=1 Tax=Henosepilachna vigintioctopunctata TaxID=420089 RepID=A0AAW1U1H4_9CUCU